MTEKGRNSAARKGVRQVELADDEILFTDAVKEKIASYNELLEGVRSGPEGSDGEPWLRYRSAPRGRRAAANSRRATVFRRSWLKADLTKMRAQLGGAGHARAIKAVQAKERAALAASEAVRLRDAADTRGLGRSTLREWVRRGHSRSAFRGPRGTHWFRSSDELDAELERFRCTECSAYALLSESGRCNRHPPSVGVYWGLRRAAEHYRVASKTLKAWLELNAPWLLVRRGGGFQLDPMALERVLSGHRCAEDGCERLALGESDACAQHRLPRDQRGKPRDPHIVAKVAASLRARTEEERVCAWTPCGVRFVVPRHSTQRCHSKPCASKLRWQEHPDQLTASRRGRIVTCACGRTTRYLCPSWLAVVHCRYCYTSTPAVRKRKSLALQRFLASPPGQRQLAAKLPLLQIGHEQWRSRVDAKVETLKRDGELVGMTELYAQHGLSEYMRNLLLEPELEEVEGLPLLLYLEQDVRQVKRSWRGGGDHRRWRWLKDEDFVVRWAAGAGLTRRLVERGFSEREAETRILQHFRRRRKQLLSGRPPADERHDRWLELALDILDAERPLFPHGLTQISQVLDRVVQADRREHPGDWPESKYGPAGIWVEHQLIKRARDRVNRAIRDDLQEPFAYYHRLQRVATKLPSPVS